MYRVCKIILLIKILRTMKNFKKLSREELKNTFGGQACTLTIQGSDGTWTTRTWTCQTRQVTKVGDSTATIIWNLLTAESYCETGLGYIPVTSNGGVSRCN